VLPIGAYNATYAVTLSLPGVIGREGVSRQLEPPMSDEERQALAHSAEVLRQAVQRILPPVTPTATVAPPAATGRHAPLSAT
jgi:malate/lactate dehydrogenase